MNYARGGQGNYLEMVPMVVNGLLGVCGGTAEIFGGSADLPGSGVAFIASQGVP